nr:DNA binding protein [Microvirus sp.]
MIHSYFGIYDRVAKSYVHITENRSAETMARMCDIMAKDEKTFLGATPGDFKAYKLAEFNDETGEFVSIEPEKVWEGKPNE